MKKSFHIIGLGRVGQTFATVIPQSGRWRLACAVSRSGGGVREDNAICPIVPRIGLLPRADAVLVCTPDNAIEEAAAELARLPWLSAQTLVVHFSGAKTIGALNAVVKCGATIGSLHPVFAFADVAQSVRLLRGNLCALEAGDTEAMAGLHDLADAAGLRAFEIPSAQKARYHAALSAASNFSVTLAAFAQDLLRPLNLPEPLARDLVCNLLRQSVENLSHLPPVQALTGPVVRGDDSTVAAYLAALSGDERQLYRMFALSTLALAAPRLGAEAQEALRSVLTDGGPL